MIKKTIIYYFFIFGVFLIASCEMMHDDTKNIFTKEPQFSVDIPFEQVLYVETSDFSESSQEIIRTEEEWCKFWERLYETKCDTSLIDFEKDSVLYVALGQRTNTCYGIEITSISRTENKLQVFYDEIVPGQSCVCGDMIVTPLDAVKIENANYEGVEEVEFIHHIRILNCS